MIDSKAIHYYGYSCIGNYCGALHMKGEPATCDLLEKFSLTPQVCSQVLGVLHPVFEEFRWDMVDRATVCPDHYRAFTEELLRIRLLAEIGKVGQF